MSGKDSLFGSLAKMQFSIPLSKRVHLLQLGSSHFFWQNERSVQRVITTLRLLGTFQYTTLFSAVYNFTKHYLN